MERSKARRAIVPRRVTYEEIRRIWPPLLRGSPTMRQSSLSLLLGLVGFLGSGLVLARYTEVLLLVPGLVTLLPASNALRGNIYAPFGSRLGTYLHTGLIRTRLGRSRILDQNLLATTAQSLVMALLLALLSWSTLRALGVTVVSLEHLIFVATVSATVGAIVLPAAAFVLSSLAFRRGLDPDNLNAPVITAGGDLLSVALVIGLGFALLTTGFSPWLVYPVDALAVGATLVLLARTSSLRRPIARQIFRQSLPILAVTVALELGVGLALEANLSALVTVPALLILIPPFIGSSGNLASVFSSRLSSAAHLGMTRIRRRPDAHASADMGEMVKVAAVLYPAIGLSVVLLSVLLGLPPTDPGALLVAGLLAGALVTAIVLPLGYYTTFVAFRLGADPDNVVIPITNSAIDVVGVLLLLGAASLFGLT